MKILSLIISFALLLSLCGCGAKNIERGTAAADSSETLPPDAPISEAATESGDSQTDKDGGLTPIYDNTAVVQAYLSGDESWLDEKQITVLKGAKEAISEFYSPDMSDEEAVIAAHDWITTNVTYDTGMLETFGKQTPDTENPYGVFTTNMGICMGYTTTFQLFMDMLGVESMVIRGEASDEEHAWNLVNLDGKWYHVDCTWDDFVPDEPDRPAFHLYLLVPDYAMEVLHIWNHDNYPAAISEDKIFLKTHGCYAKTPQDCNLALHEAVDSGQAYAELMSDEKENFVYDGQGVTYWPTDMGKYHVAVFWLTEQ